MIYESGYNLEPGTLRASEADQFYVDFSRAYESASFNDELTSAVLQLKKEREIFLIDDGSLPARALRPYFEPSRSLSLTLENGFDSKFWLQLNREFQISRREHLALLTLSRKLRGTVIWPTTDGRIFNLNYRRVRQTSLGAPYWVYGASESFHKVSVAATSLQLDICPDLLKLSPGVWRAFFLHPLQLAMMLPAEFHGPHNDRIEREIWAAVRGGHEDLYPEPLAWPNLPDLHSYKDQIAHFPMHSFLRHYLAMDVPCNQLEEGLYGTAY